MRRLPRRTVLGGLIATVVAACTRSSDDAVPSTEVTTPSSTGTSSTSDAASTSTTGPTTSTFTETTQAAPTIEPLATEPVDLPTDAFALGVASGDPDADGVVIWTRVVGELPTTVPMVWEVASDEAMSELVATGRIDASETDAHSVRVLVEALGPARTVWYRFRAGEQSTIMGRTCTLPAVGDPSAITLAVSSCQDPGGGAWAAHRDLAATDVDLVVWLGDYVYGDHRTLDDYRQAYASARLDPELRASHAAHPWFCLADDHEVANDYDASVDPARRVAAYRAWWEHMPTRLPPPDDDGRLRFHRHIDLGGAGRLIGLDVRQYATADQLLGPDQLAEVASALRHDGAATVVASPVLVSGVRDPEGEPLLPYTIDTRPAERARLVAALGSAPRPVVVSGDLHTSLVADVLVDPDDPDAGSVAVEIMAPAVSSAFPERYAPFAPFLPLVNPQLRDVRVQNGWLELAIAGDGAVSASNHFVDDIADPASAISIVPVRV